MNDFDFLIGQYDIIEVIYKQHGLINSLIITFKWEVDCGCFSYYKESVLTVYIPNKLEDYYIEEIKKETGKFYQYILNHKEYVGELLDLRGESL